MKRILFLCFAALLSTSVWSQKNDSISFHQSYYTTDYALSTPKAYNLNEAKNYPLIIALHGAGFRGLPPSKIVTDIILVKDKYWPNYDAFVVAPVCHKGVNWEPIILNEWLKDLIAKYRIDPDRVYLTGVSMGGYGTWKWASKNPELFAAIVPVCGGGNPDDAWAMRNLPIWAAHGQDDDVVPCSESVKMVDALKAMGANPRLDIYPGVKHDAQEKIFYNIEFYDWLFSQKRQPMPSIEILAADMDKYVGDYKFDWGVVNIFKENGKLQSQVVGQDKTMEMLSDAPGRFYITSSGNNMILFQKSPSGEVESLMLYGNEKPITAQKIK